MFQFIFFFLKLKTYRSKHRKEEAAFLDHAMYFSHTPPFKPGLPGNAGPPGNPGSPFVPGVPGKPGRPGSPLSP